MSSQSVAANKRPREPEQKSSDTASTIPPLKKQKTDTASTIIENIQKASTPPLDLDEIETDSNAAASAKRNPNKPALKPAPSSGSIPITHRNKKPGLAKVPSNALAFNGEIVAPSPSKSVVVEGEEKKQAESNNVSEVHEDNASGIMVDVNRQKLIAEFKDLLAPCSRDLISRGKIECVVWFDQDDDSNECAWIARIVSTVFDESKDVTSMLCSFPGFGDASNVYWLPCIWRSQWLVYQPNTEILNDAKYATVWHKENFDASQSLLAQTKEYLSDLSDDDDDGDGDDAYEVSEHDDVDDDDDDDDYDEDDDIVVKPKKKKKKKKKTVRKKKQPRKRIKTKIENKRKKTKKKALAAAAVSAHAPKYVPQSTKYSHTEQRLQTLDDVDTTTMSFCPVSKKHLVAPPDPTSSDVDQDLIEIVFSFDTTGSMSACLETVRIYLKKILNLLFADVPKLRIAVLAHGDYCDERIFYVMRWVDLTNDKEKLMKFVDEVHGTGGGDAPECYELVLHNVARQISWSANCANRVLVLIGDANPHELSGYNPYKLDWREKIKDCKSCGIKIYGIHCLNNYVSQHFYRTISEDTNGVYITLDKIQSFAGMMVALCHREKDLISYDENKESELCKQEKEKFDAFCTKLEEFSVMGLKDMLRHNAQKVSGTKYELMHRIADCQMYGCMPRCTQCGGGHLRVIYINGKKYGHNGKGRYFCPGFYNGDEYVACLWSGDESKVVREKWTDMDAEEPEEANEDDVQDNNSE